MAHAAPAGTRKSRTSRTGTTSYTFVWFIGRVRDGSRYAEKIKGASFFHLRMSEDDIEHDFQPVNARLRLGAMELSTGTACEVWNLIRQAGIAQRSGLVGGMIGPFLVKSERLAQFASPEAWYLSTSRHEHFDACLLGYRLYEVFFDNKEQIWNCSGLPAFMKMPTATLVKRDMPKRVLLRKERMLRLTSETRST